MKTAAQLRAQCDLDDAEALRLLTVTDTEDALTRKLALMNLGLFLQRLLQERRAALQPRIVEATDAHP